MAKYEVGQVWPIEGQRGIIGAKLPKAEWYALTVFSMREREVAERLKQKGVHACFPDQEKSWVIRGKRHKRKYPVISGIVYAKFRHAPQWDILKARRLITGVFCMGNKPLVIPGEIVRAVMGLPTTAERIEAAQRELMRVRDGDRAKMIGGPLDGLVVNVESVKHGRVWFETLTGIKGEVAVDKVKRQLT